MHDIFVLPLKGLAISVLSKLFYSLLSLQLKDKASISVDNLQRCVQCGKTIKMPSFNSITVPNEYQDTPILDWDLAVDVAPEEYTCQVGPCV